jgi:plastocyanin
MIRTIARLSLTTGFALCLVSAQAYAQWGNLTGKFVYGGTPPTPAKLDINKDVEVCGKHPLVDESLLVDANGGIANVVIWVRTKGVQVASSYDSTADAKLVYDNKGCRFEPHILPIRLSQTLELHNSDPIGHNSNMQPLGDQGINPLLPSDSAAEYKFSKAQIVPTPVTCNIHPWMKGYIVARDNPYVAVSKADGTFELKDLPAGELEFQAWQEKSGYLATPNWTKGRFKLEIKAGNNDLGTITVDPSLFNK